MGLLKLRLSLFGVLAVILAGCTSQAPSASPAATAASATVAAPAAKAAASPSSVVSMGLSNEPSKLDPHVTTGTSGRTVALLVYRGLYNFGTDGKPTPQLADSFQLSDDHKTYTFKLRSATFHNGDPVTADDVKYSFERILDEKTGASFRSQLSVIDSVQASDPSTVRFTLKAPTAPFIQYLALPESAIVSKKWTQEKVDLTANPMGAGPYTLKEWKKGQSITLEKFDKFYASGLPKTPTIRFSFLADDSARVNALRAGDVDLIEYVPWAQAETLQSDKNLQLQSTKGPFMGLLFNTEFKPFSDPRVRRAVGYAIDRQAVIDTAFNARGWPIWGMAMPEASVAYDPKFDAYFKLDLDKARSLLAEAGYPNGFKARMLATSQYAFHQQTAVVVKSELAKIGIDLELDMPDWATRLAKTGKGDHDLVVVGTAGDIGSDPDFISDYYQSGPLRLNSAPGFADARVDELLAAGRAELDETKRKAIYADIQQRVLDESPLVYLMWRDQSYASKKSLTGFTNLPGFLSFQSGITLESATLSK
jgi:glutathione transport system substrate-binding protein